MLGDDVQDLLDLRGLQRDPLLGEDRTDILRVSGEDVRDFVGHRLGHEVDLASGEIFPVDHRFEVTRKDKIDQLFSRWWLIVLRRINAGTALLRTGKVNHYVLFAMLFLLLVFLLSLFNWLK